MTSADDDRRLDTLVAGFAGHASSAGIFSDFDGTLAAIVDDPGAARPLPGAADVLAALALRYRKVGVISGRPASFLARHLGGRGLELAGLYGMELVVDGEVRPSPAAAPWRPVVEEAASRAEAELAPGVGVERKGLSVAVHFRTCPEHEGQARRWAGEESSRSGLAVHPARMSFELRPPLPHDKGRALEAMAAGLSHVLFVGDDLGDVHAFDALDRLAAGPGRADTVRVAVFSREAPAELVRRADVVVDGPEGALEMLRRLASGRSDPA